MEVEAQGTVESVGTSGATDSERNEANVAAVSEQVTRIYCFAYCFV